MIDEDVLADVKINLVKVPVNIDRQIVSGMRMPLVASATQGTLQGILIQSMVRGLTRGRVGPVMSRPSTRVALRTQRAQRYDPSRFRSSSEAHSQLIRQTDKEWRQIVQRSAGNPQQLKRETDLFYNRLRSRIGNYQVDRVKRGEISLEQAIPRPTGGRLEPTRALQGRQSALQGRAPEATKFVESVQPSSTKRIAPARDTSRRTGVTTQQEATGDTTRQLQSAMRDTTRQSTTTRRIPATITGNINPRTTQFTQRQTEVFTRGNEYGNVREDLLRRGILDLPSQRESNIIVQRESHRIGLERQRQMFMERREASEAATRPINRNDGGSGDDIRFREGK